MPLPGRPLEIRHSCLTDSRHGTPLDAAPLTDRQRLGLLLSGCSLDAHLRRLGRRPADWLSARVSTDGGLVAVTTEAGEAPAGEGEAPCERALLLLRRLFGSDLASGRGVARRAARELARRWTLYLTPISADDLVADVLRAAPFLWLEPFGIYRESLAALIRHGDRDRLWVAGPAAFRRRALRGARTLPELCARLRSDRAAALWHGETAHEVREPVAKESDALERLVALHRAGRWRAVASEALRQRRDGGTRGRECEAARLAIDAHLRLRRWRGAAEWAAFAGARSSAAEAADARLLAAWVARARGERASVEAPPTAGSVESLLIWAHCEAEWDPTTVIERLSTALRRRSRESSARGRLWLELGLARRIGGAGRATDRALAHAQRHLGRGDRAVDRWRVAAALVEARLPRGALDGLDGVVASLSEQARADADPGRELEASILDLRLDLAHGRDDRATATAGALLDRLPRRRGDAVAREIEALGALARSRLDDRTRAAHAGRAEDPSPRVAVSPSPNRARPGDLVGGSHALGEALQRIDRLARGEVPVLLCGETGTGKELAAKRLHGGSPRRARPFLAVNCAALSESLLLSELFGHARGAFTGADREHAGVFEAAHGGVVFLDEIGDLPLGAQGALLRVLQEGEVRRLGESRPRRVDVRVVAATHRDLEAWVERGAFRQDLYYRLNVASVRLPPLRERGRDVLVLARHFLAEHGGAFELAADAEQLLLSCSWPGNVRELRSVVQVAAAVHDGDGLLRARDLELQPAPRPLASYHAALDAERRRLLGEALSVAGGRRVEAARLLGITPQAVSYLVRRLGLELRPHRV